MLFARKIVACLLPVGVLALFLLMASYSIKGQLWSPIVGIGVLLLVGFLFVFLPAFVYPGNQVWVAKLSYSVGLVLWLLLNATIIFHHWTDYGTVQLNRIASMLIPILSGYLAMRFINYLQQGKGG
jgi:hypothetical protein